MVTTVQADEHLYPIPKFDLDKEDIQNFSKQLKGFHEQFLDCFQRSESREHFYNYMAGQFSQLKRKSIEPIALAMQDGNVRAMQRFVSDTKWYENNIISKYRSLVDEDLGSSNGVLIVDEVGFPKKGRDSAGVARQPCPPDKNLVSCQVGVFAAYASEHGYALVDKRLFMPEQWFSSDYQELRLKCMLPEDLVFKTRPLLAADMIRAIAAEKKLPFKYVVAGSVSETGPEFIKTVEALPDITYLIPVSRDTQCRLKKPVSIAELSPWNRKTLPQPLADEVENKSLAMGDLAESINDYFWYRISIHEGARGPAVYEFTRCQVMVSFGELPRKTMWLLVQRTLGKNPKYRFFLANTSTGARFKTLVWLSGMPWAIEQCIAEGNANLGMSHYEMRKFKGWHHHILTCMLAHFFLWHLKIRTGKKSREFYAVTPG